MPDTVESLRDVIRELFYFRLPTGQKFEELLTEQHETLWQRCYRIINPISTRYGGSTEPQGIRAWEAQEALLRAACPNAPTDRVCAPAILDLVPWCPDPTSDVTAAPPAPYQGTPLIHAKALRTAYRDAIARSKHHEVGSSDWVKHRSFAVVIRQWIRHLGHDLLVPDGWEMDTNWPMLPPKPVPVTLAP